MVTHTLIGCEALICNSESCILLGLRINCYGAGTWALPGGHLEIGEKLCVGCVRELQEELGIEVDQNDCKLVAITDDIRTDFHFVHVTFEITKFTGNISVMEPDRCAEWRFFPRNELPKDIFLPHQKIFNTLLSNQIYKTEQEAI